MIPVSSGDVRLFLHVLGATVWVGGQLALAAVVPTVRTGGGRELVRLVARRFQLVAWPAYALLVVTGIWNLAEVRLGDRTTAYLATLMVKLTLVALSGLAAAGHALLTGPRVARAADESEARRRRALSGATAGLSLLFALGAAFFGIQLAG